MSFPDLADRSAPDKFHRPPQAVFRAPLVAHLRHHLLFGRRQPHHPGFVHGAGQRFLTVNMFSMFHRRDRSHRVRVVRCGHQHSVDLRRHFVEHPVKVPKRFGRRAFLVNVARP